jgi:catechol 2,3-dioxygenase-like lactoylglutathione lyase family enzyme
VHHTSIRTANIYRAIAFYEALGFEMEERFTAGITLACWMTGLGGRIELLQVPQPNTAPDAFSNEHYVGYYHLSFDLTDICSDLTDWLDNLRAKFTDSASQSPDISPQLEVLLEPTQQIIGDRVYEVTFIADSDRLPLEFIRLMGKVGGT